MSKIKSDFFSGFSTDIDDEMSNTDVPVKKTDTGAEEVKDSKEEFEDDAEDDEVESNEVDREDDEQAEDIDEDPFIATINHLAEKGIISFDEEHEYEEEGEELLERVFAETRERDRQEWIDEIPEDYQSIIKHMQTGGKLEDWIDAVKPTDFDLVDIEDESTQKALIEDHLASTGMDDEDIQERIQEMEDLGTLEKGAKTAVKYLKKNEDNKIQSYEQELDKVIQAQKAREADELDDFKYTVLSTETLKDIKLTKEKREKLFNHITKATNKQGESQFVINQKNMENQLLLAYMDMEGFSFKDLEKRATTKAVSGLRNSLTKFTDKNASSAGGATGRTNTTSRKLPVSGPWSTSTEIED